MEEQKRGYHGWAVLFWLVALVCAWAALAHHSAGLGWVAVFAVVIALVLHFVPHAPSVDE